MKKKLEMVEPERTLSETSFENFWKAITGACVTRALPPQSGPDAD